MEQIVIFNTEPTQLDIVDAEIKNEKEIFIHNLRQHDVKDAEIFYDMNTYINEHTFIDSTIDVVLFQQIVAYITPIIKDIPRCESDMIVSSKRKSQGIKPQGVKPVVNEIGITFTVDKDTACLFNGMEVIAPKHSNINIIGVKIPEQFQKTYQYLYNYLVYSDPKDLVLSGVISPLTQFTDNYFVFDKPIKFDIASISTPNPIPIPVPIPIPNPIPKPAPKFKPAPVPKPNPKPTPTPAPKPMPIPAPTLILFTKDNIQPTLKYIIDAVKIFRYYNNANTALLYKNIIKTDFFKQDISKPITSIKCSPFINNLSRLLGVNICYGNIITTSNSIFNIGYYDYYNKLCLTNNKIFYDELKYEYDKRHESEKAAASLVERRLELIQKNKISMEKFDKIEGLSDKQIKIVEQEYKKLISTSIVPEIQIANDLNDAIRSRDQPEIKKLVTNLISIDTTKPDKSDKVKYPMRYIVKNNINIICYHVITKAQLLLKEYKNVIEENHIIRETLVSEYSISENDGYFCKICGEKIDESRDSDGLTVESKLEYSASSFDKLYLTIYKEVVYIINNFVNFGGEHKYSIKDIVENLTNVLKPAIYDIEAGLLKIKTIGQEDLSETLNIYIYIYTFAFITQLIYINDSITFKQIMFYGAGSPFITNGGNSSGSPFIDDRDDSSDSPFIDDNDDSSGSPFIDDRDDSSGSPFIDDRDDSSGSPFGGKVPKKTSSKTSKVPKKTSSKTNKTPAKAPASTNLNKVLSAKTQNTKQNAKQLQNLINIALNILIKLKRNEIQKSKIIKMDNLKIIFLDAYKWIMNIKYTVSSVSTESYWDSNNNLLNYLFYGFNKTVSSASEKDNYKKVLGRSKEEIIENPKNIYDNIQKPVSWGTDPYYYESLMSVYDYINDKLYLENSYKSPALEKYYKKYEHLLAIDKQNKKETKQLSPLISIPYIKYVPDTTTIKFQSCKNADYLYKKIDKHGNLTKETMILQADEIKTWLTDCNYKKIAEFKQWYLTEVKCKDGNDAKKIPDKIIAFYEFYKDRCPIGNLHDFVDSQQSCAKCKISPEKINSFDITYYNKYVAVYDKFRKIDADKGAILQRSKSQKHQKQIDFPKWTVTNKPIIKLALLLKISPNAINNIGMYEKQEYNKDKFEKSTLHSDTPEEFIKRNNNLFDYYLFIIKSYYKLRSSEFLIDIPNFIKKFLIKYSNVNLSTKLEFINKDFLDKYAYYKKKLNPEVFSNFLLNSIAETLLTIASKFEAKSMKAMGAEFIHILFDEIVMFEKHLTIFINKKMTHAEPAESDDQYFESYSPDGDDTEDVVALPEMSEDEDYEVVDPFSIADMDVEYDEDNLYKDVVDKMD
jgi:hypothetical protein